MGTNVAPNCSLWQNRGRPFVAPDQGAEFLKSAAAKPIHTQMLSDPGDKNVTDCKIGALTLWKKGPNVVSVILSHFREIRSNRDRL